MKKKRVEGGTETIFSRVTKISPAWGWLQRERKKQIEAKTSFCLEQRALEYFFIYILYLGGGEFVVE